MVAFRQKWILIDGGHWCFFVQAWRAPVQLCVWGWRKAWGEPGPSRHRSYAFCMKGGQAGLAPSTTRTAFYETVTAAYGWTDYTPGMPESEILSRLLVLNLERSGGRR